MHLHAHIRVGSLERRVIDPFFRVLEDGLQSAERLDLEKNSLFHIWISTLSSSLHSRTSRGFEVRRGCSKGCFLWLGLGSLVTAKGISGRVNTGTQLGMCFQKRAMTSLESQVGANGDF